MNAYSEPDPSYLNYHFRHYDSSRVAGSSASSSTAFTYNQRRQMTRQKKRPTSLYYGTPSKPFYRRASSPTSTSSNALSSAASQRPSHDQRSMNPPYLSSSPASSSSGTSASSSGSSVSYFTWLVFLNEKWVPFDPQNQAKLEQTLSSGGTFVDVSDSHFPNVKRVRIFPRSNYLSYLGVKYRLSRIMQPDAWLDHVNLEREHRPSSTCNDGLDSVASSQKTD